MFCVKQAPMGNPDLIVLQSDRNPRSPPEETVNHTENPAQIDQVTIFIYIYLQQTGLSKPCSKQATMCHVMS